MIEEKCQFERGSSEEGFWIYSLTAITCELDVLLKTAGTTLGMIKLERMNELRWIIKSKRVIQSTQALITHFII